MQNLSTQRKTKAVAPLDRLINRAGALERASESPPPSFVILVFNSYAPAVKATRVEILASKPIEASDHGSDPMSPGRHTTCDTS